MKELTLEQKIECCDYIIDELKDDIKNNTSSGICLPCKYYIRNEVRSNTSIRLKDIKLYFPELHKRVKRQVVRENGSYELTYAGWGNTIRDNRLRLAFMKRLKNTLTNQRTL